MGSRDPRDERPSEYTDFKFSVSCRSLFLPAASIGYQNINLIRVEVLWGKERDTGSLSRLDPSHSYPNPSPWHYRTIPGVPGNSLTISF